jgi:hypothetical protein
METAFAPYDGAHAEQSAFTRQLIEESIAEYDAGRRLHEAAASGPTTPFPKDIANDGLIRHTRNGRGGGNS